MDIRYILKKACLNLKASGVPLPHSHIPLIFPIGHFYSPITDPADLRARETRIWAASDEMPGIDLNVDSQLGLLKELAPFTADIDWPIDKPADPTRYYYGNDQYPVLDAGFSTQCSGDSGRKQ